MCCCVQNVCWDGLQPPIPWSGVEMNGWCLLPQLRFYWIIHSGVSNAATITYIQCMFVVCINQELSSPILTGVAFLLYALYDSQSLLFISSSRVSTESKAAESKGMINPQVPTVFSVGCLAAREPEHPLLFTVSMALRTAVYSDSTLRSFSCSLLCHRGKRHSSEINSAEI